MMNLVDELQTIARVLRDAGVVHAVCGGLAVTLHGATRTTKDIDLLVFAQDIPRILDLVRPLGYVFAALPLTFEAGTERERRVQRVSKIADGEHLCVDLLAADGVYDGLLDNTLEFQLPEGRLAVISLAGLIKMKRLAGRPQDLADLVLLEGPNDDPQAG
jgi:hypothetical protein